jgi:hypothetical protein
LAASPEPSVIVNTFSYVCLGEAFEVAENARVQVYVLGAVWKLDELDNSLLFLRDQFWFYLVHAVVNNYVFQPIRVFELVKDNNLVLPRLQVPSINVKITTVFDLMGVLGQIDETDIVWCCEAIEHLFSPIGLPLFYHLVPLFIRKTVGRLQHVL